MRDFKKCGDPGNGGEWFWNEGLIALYGLRDRMADSLKNVNNRAVSDFGF